MKLNDLIIDGISNINVKDITSIVMPSDSIVMSLPSSSYTFSSLLKEEKKMLEIRDVNVEYEKRTIVDDTKRDANGNYATSKIDVPVATIVTFENGNSQVAVCDDNDEFNIETGISICVTRELMERLYGICGMTNAYNKIIRDGIKVYKNHCKHKERMNKLKAEQEAIEKNRKIKEQKRRQKRAAKKKEREIEILTEAMKRAKADSNK